MTISPIIQDLISFLDLSPTSLHAASQVLFRLRQAGYKELSGEKYESIQPGQLYVISHHSSAICAFIAPWSKPKRVRLLASHLDSPCLKLKPHAEINKHQSTLLSVEIYGSPLISSWLNRDLGLAGRIVFQDNSGQIKEQLVKLDRYPFTIPQLAIHLDREVNERGLLLNKQEHLSLLSSLRAFSSSFLESILREEVKFDTLIAHDLFAYPLEKARLLGYPQEMLASYRIDSLASVHASLRAILEQPLPLEDELKMIIFWDHEEVGSQSSQGALSPFFIHIMERILANYDIASYELFDILNRSTCISIDLAHALHPNYIDKYDEQHRTFLGKGIVVKHNAQQRYATNIRSAIPVYRVAELNGLHLQHFVSRNDMPCGTTIGPLHAALTGMPTIDIGCGQLSMHSCREIMACQDHLDMCKLLSGLLEVAEWPVAITT